MNNKPFVLLTVLNTIKKYIFIFISNEDIYPIYGCKTYKIQSIGIIKLIFPAHLRDEFDAKINMPKDRKFKYKGNIYIWNERIKHSGAAQADACASVRRQGCRRSYGMVTFQT
jgi:hypothetical protein